MRKLFPLILLIIISTSVYSQQYLIGFGKFYPENKYYESSFESFLIKFKNAINNYDKDYIYSVIDPDIELNLDDPLYGKGFNSFKHIYNLNDSNSVFWKIDKRILSWGGTKSVEDGILGYRFPTIAINEYIDKYLDKLEIRGINTESDDINLFGLAIGENINVYSRPSVDSKIIGFLNYDFVKIIRNDYDNNNWHKIELKNKIVGFIKKDEIYKELGDYCLAFDKINNKWFLSFIGLTEI